MQPLGVTERLRLLRYGLIVVVVVTLMLSVLIPMVSVSAVYGPLSAEIIAYNQANPGSALPVPATPDMMAWLPLSLIITAVVAVVCVGLYFGYKSVLERAVAPAAGK